MDILPPKSSDPIYKFSDDVNDDIMQLYINGILVASGAIGNTFAGSTSGAINFGSPGRWDGGVDFYLDDFYTTNNPNTPQISTMLGVGPRYMPRETITTP